MLTNRTKILDGINRCVAQVNFAMTLQVLLGAAIVSITGFSSKSDAIMILGLTLMTPAVTAMLVCSIVARQLRRLAEQPGEEKDVLASEK